MTFSNKPESAMTVASVTAELEELEAYYKSRRKKLRAVLPVLREEEAEAANAKTVAKDDADGKEAADAPE